MALTKTRAVGGSLIVTIPKEVVENEDITEGDIVELVVEKAKKSFFGVTKKLPSFTADDELVSHD